MDHREGAGVENPASLRELNVILVQGNPRHGHRTLVVDAPSSKFTEFELTLLKIARNGSPAFVLLLCL